MPGPGIIISLTSLVYGGRADFYPEEGLKKSKAEDPAKNGEIPKPKIENRRAVGPKIKKGCNWPQNRKKGQTPRARGWMCMVVKDTKVEGCFDWV